MFEEFRGKLQKLTYMDFDGHDRIEGITMNLSEAELLSEITKAPANDLFLGKYDVDAITELLHKYGIMRQIEELGFKDIKVELRMNQVFNHRLYVYEGVRDYDHILIELRLREGTFTPREQFLEGVYIGSHSMILVDWMMLQNPREEFKDKRPALPHQRYPGLGVLQNFIPLVSEVVKETGRTGVLDVPEHYHGALFYSRWFRFYNPEIEGKFLAMQRDLSDYPLYVVTHAIFNDCLFNATEGKLEKWVPGEQIMSLCDELSGYFGHRLYAEARDRAFLGNKYELDMERYETIVKEMENKGELVE